ncbi:MAG: MBL fold metallo-hydrolase, partial [Gammaproteobacteria bacterium]|nr:MBL fold metallo-hydrolase [Gammaproteobacteria bacterium]
MKQLYPDLWQSKRQTSGILNTYTYYLQTPDANFLIYNTGDSEDLDHVEQLGGIEYQLLTHRDEAGASLTRIQERFGATLMFSELEAEAISNHAKADAYFEKGDHSLGDIEVLETPGHTGGSVS